MIAIKLAHFGRADKLVRSALIFNPLILSGNRKKRGKAGKLPFLNRWNPLSTNHITCAYNNQNFFVKNISDC